MADNKRELTLAQCIEHWRNLSVKNLAWLELEDPNTPVDYVDIPDLIGRMTANGQYEDLNIPGWTFNTTQGEFRFIVKDGYLYPESVCEPEHGYVNHRSRYFDMKADVERNIFCSLEKSVFRTKFGHGVAQLVHGIDNPDTETAMTAWLMFSEGYHQEVEYSIGEYKRRKAFAKYSGIMSIVTKKSDLFDAFNEGVRYMVIGDEYSKDIKPAYFDPDTWGDLQQVPLEARLDFFMKTWDLPGANQVLNKLAHAWDIKGWLMLEALVDTSEYPVEAIQPDGNSVRTIVANALGLGEKNAAKIELPSFV